MPHPTPDPIDSLLDQWGKAPPSPSMAAAVRARLQARPAEPENLFARPAFAAMFVAACVLLGLFLAEIRLSRLHHDRDAELLESYRRLIDPLVTTAPVAAIKEVKT